MLERVVDRSRMACLPRLLRMERLARERSAVMWVMEILGDRGTVVGTWVPPWAVTGGPGEGGRSHLPSNLCLRKSKRAFCIMSVTCRRAHQPGEPMVSRRQMAPAGRWQPPGTLPAALGPTICPPPARDGQGGDEGCRPPPWGCSEPSPPNHAVLLYLISFQRGPHQHHGPHGGDHVVGWDVLCLRGDMGRRQCLCSHPQGERGQRAYSREPQHPGAPQPRNQGQRGGCLPRPVLSPACSPFPISPCPRDSPASASAWLGEKREETEVGVSEGGMAPGTPPPDPSGSGPALT